LSGGADRGIFLTTFENRDAAIKLLFAEQQIADAQLSRWRAAQALSHPNLLRIFAMGRSEVDDLPLVYIVTEYAEEDLSQVLPDRPLTAVEAREMLEPALGALEFVHREGFVHSHLKPANIMAVQDGLKISSDSIRRTAANDRGERGPYDPPERAQGIVSPAGDVWSLGITLVEVLTQRLPAAETTVVFHPDLPEPFAEIARHCLRTNPTERWTVSQILRSLTPGGGGTLASPAPPRKKRKVAPVGVFIILAVVVVLVAGVMLRRSESDAALAIPATSAAPTAAPKEAPKAPAVQSAPVPEPASPREVAKEPKQKPPKETPVSEPAAATETPAADATGQPMPEIPANARRTIRGKVTVNVRVDVDPSGRVTDAKIESPGASKYFTERTLKAVRQWKFQPISVNGSDAGQRWNLRFEIRTSGTKVQPKRLSP
jgi:TonB family protein